MTSIADQLATEPHRAAPGSLSARGLTLRWDLDTLTLERGGTREAIAFESVSLQVSRSVTEPGRLDRRRRPLLRVELRGPDGLRLRLRALAEPAALTGLPELAGDDDHTVELEALRALLDAARAGGATVANAATTAPLDDQAPLLTRHRGAWAVAWYAASVTTVAGAALTGLGISMLPGFLVGTLFVKLALLTPTLALFRLLLRVRAGRPPAGRFIMVAAAGFALMLCIAQLSGAGFWHTWYHHLGGMDVTLCGHALLQLGALVLAVLPWRWSLVADRDRMTWSSDFARTRSVAWRDRVDATDATLHPESSRLLGGAGVRTALDLASGRPGGTHSSDERTAVVWVLQRRRRVARALLLLFGGVLWVAHVADTPAYLVHGPLSVTACAIPIVAVLWGVARSLRVQLLAVDLDRDALVERTVAWPDAVSNTRLYRSLPASEFYADRPTARWTGCSLQHVGQVRYSTYRSGYSVMELMARPDHASALSRLHSEPMTGDVSRLQQLADKLHAALPSTDSPAEP